MTRVSWFWKVASNRCRSRKAVLTRPAVALAATIDGTAYAISRKKPEIAAGRSGGKGHVFRTESIIPALPTILTTARTHS